MCSGTNNRSHHAVGEQPVPGYHLLEPLGQGGFGEVWKCEAPGGLYKAIKFVHPRGDGSSPAVQEREALKRITSVRHPFILSLDRVEVIEGVLLIIMELADQSLHGLLADCLEAGQMGVPRHQLLRLLGEAAEALDWMNFEHNLQHLDVKPHNLFLVSNHIKVADFGLVDQLQDVNPHAEAPPVQIPGRPPSQPRPVGGITPLYSSPELFRGVISRHSDQYSLAIVYQQLLTGTVPFWASGAFEMMQLHLGGEPNLIPLPSRDRPLVARALAKDPAERFPSCVEFIQALQDVRISTTGGSLAALAKKEGSSTPFRTGSPTRNGQRPTHQVPSAGKPAKPTMIRSRVPMDTQTVPSVGKKGVSTLATTRPTGSQEDIPGANDTTFSPQGGLRGDVVLFEPRPSNKPAREWSTLEQHDLPPVRERGASGGIENSDTGYLHEETPAVGQTTAVVVPGYRVEKCLSTSPLADLWLGVGPDRCAYRALILKHALCSDPDLPRRLQVLNHPALPPVDFMYSPDGSLILITRPLGASLRDRFEVCRGENLPGIPREELLGTLKRAAAILDQVAGDTMVSHLGLNPSNIFTDPQGVALGGPYQGPHTEMEQAIGQARQALRHRRQADQRPSGNQPPVWVADYGLVSEVWLAAGGSPAQLNARYAAPELVDSASPQADQFALALIYAEMLTGLPPRPVPLHPRGDRSRSGFRSGSRSVLQRIDLDLLPSGDREIVAQALHPQIEKRFSSCSEFIEALEQHHPEPCQGQKKQTDLYHRLPPVIPFRSLLGEPPSANTLLPPVQQLIAALIANGQVRPSGLHRNLHSAQVSRGGSVPHTSTGSGSQTADRGSASSPGNQWIHQPDGSIEYRCPLYLSLAMLPTRLNAFCQHWNACLVGSPKPGFVVELALASPRRFWEHTRIPPTRISLQVQVPQSATPTTRSEVCITLHVCGPTRPRDNFLEQAAQHLFESMQMYLQGKVEQRRQTRSPCKLPLKVYPVLPDLELSSVLDATGKDISLGGICFRVSQRPPSDKLYLHWPLLPQVQGYALLARVVRCETLGSESYEIGAAFPGVKQGS